MVPQSGGDNAIGIVPQSGEQFVKQYICQLPWGHIKVIISKLKGIDGLLFYTSQIINNNWTRDILELHIKNGLYQRKGNAITNFSHTLSEPMSGLAQETLKDPYVFDFVAFTDKFTERDIENQLVDNISKFLLELGKGFAFVGKQYHIELADKDYYLDLLFYHVVLKTPLTRICNPSAVVIVEPQQLITVR